MIEQQQVHHQQITSSTSSISSNDQNASNNNSIATMEAENPAAAAVVKMNSTTESCNNSFCSNCNNPIIHRHQTNEASASPATLNPSPIPTTTTTTTTPTTASTTTTSSPTQPDIATYLTIFNHAIRCTQSPSCATYSRCVQFRRIMAHTRVCVKNKLNECDMCRQLIALTIMHAKTCRDETCPAPHCATVKARLDELNEMRARVESAYEFVRARFDLLDYTPTRSIALQTIHEHEDENDENNKMELDEQPCESSQEQERAKLVSEIERVKQLDASAPNRTNRLKTDVKFSKELAKCVFKKLINAHQLADQCYSSVHYARLARIFMLENLALLRKVAATTTTTTSSPVGTDSAQAIDLDDYLMLVIDLAYRFDRMLGKHTIRRSSVECQTSSVDHENTVEQRTTTMTISSEKRRDRDWEKEEPEQEEKEVAESSSCRIVPEAKKLRSV